jgi:serine/threonine protein kinase
MSLAPGSRLGPYEILSALGAGGMGAVYRARDTRLKRNVAVKVLSDALSNGAEHLSRLEREAVAREPGRRLEPRDASRRSASRPVSVS